MSESALRSLEILERLSDSAGMTVSEIARELSLSRATVSRLFASLEEGGWILPLEGDKRFVPSLRLVSAAATALHHNRTRELLLPWLLELAERTSLVSGLCFYERGRMTVTDSTEIVAEHLVTRFDGATFPLATTAGGKALLAYRPEAEIAAIAAQGGVRLSDGRPLTPEEIIRDAQETRDRGYATNDRVSHEDASGLAVPIFDRSARVAAAIGIVIPGALTQEVIDQLAPVALGVASRASLALGYTHVRPKIG